MISFVLAAAWQALLLGFSLVSALVGRPRHERPAVDPTDPTDAYELNRWHDRIEHQRRLREDELAQLRRSQAAVRAAR